MPFVIVLKGADGGNRGSRLGGQARVTVGRLVCGAHHQAVAVKEQEVHGPDCRDQQQ